MKRTLFTLAILASASSAAADDCSSYPFTRGSDIIPVEGFEMPKIISTASVAPFSDDIDDVNDAMDEATLIAKSEISKFMSELVSSDATRNKITDRIAEQSGDKRQASSATISKIIKMYSSSSKAMLRGVVVLGDCYTPGKEIRVTVGLKSETLTQAEGLARGKTGSFNAAPTTSTMPSSSTKGASSGSSASMNGSIRTTEGHSNTSKLDKF